LPSCSRADQHDRPRGRCAESGPLAEFHLTEDEWYELEVAGGLHDCGKVTTHEFVVDKATKLETIYNRIHEIRTRFEIVKRDAEIEYLRAVAAAATSRRCAPRGCLAGPARRRFRVCRRMQHGRRIHGPGKDHPLQSIAEITWLRTLDDRLGLSWEESARQPQTREKLPVVEQLLADKPSQIIAHDTVPLAPDNPWGFVIKPPPYEANLGEVYNLSIRRGTLTAEERYTSTITSCRPSSCWRRCLTEEPAARPGMGRRSSREDGRNRVPARLEARPDEHPGADHDDRRHLRGADRARPALQGAQEPVRVHRHHGAHEPRAPHRPRSVRALPDLGVYRAYADIFLLPEQIDEVDISGYLASLHPPEAAVA